MRFWDPRVAAYFSITAVCVTSLWMPLHAPRSSQWTFVLIQWLCHGKTGRSVMCLDTRTLIQICNCLAYLYGYRQRARIFWSSWIGALFYDWRCSGNQEVSIPRPKRQGKYLLGKDMSCKPVQLHVHMHHTPLQNFRIASISGLAHSKPCSRSATLYAYLVAE